MGTKSSKIEKLPEIDENEELDDLVSQYKVFIDIFFNTLKLYETSGINEYDKDFNFNLKYLSTKLEKLLITITIKSLFVTDDFKWLNTTDSELKGYRFLISEAYFIFKINSCLSLFDENDGMDYVTKQLTEVMPILEKLAHQFGEGTKSSVFFQNEEKKDSNWIIQFKKLSSEDIKNVINQASTSKIKLITKIGLENAKELKKYFDIFTDSELIGLHVNGLLSSLEYRNKKLSFYDEKLKEYEYKITKNTVSSIEKLLEKNKNTKNSTEEDELKDLLDSGSLNEDEIEFFKNKLSHNKAINSVKEDLRLEYLGSLNPSQ